MKVESGSKTKRGCRGVGLGIPYKGATMTTILDDHGVPVTSRQLDQMFGKIDFEHLSPFFTTPRRKHQASTTRRHKAPFLKSVR